SCGSPTRGRPFKLKLTSRLSAIAARSRLSTDCTGLQAPKQLDELGQLVVRIQAARIRQHPDLGAFEGLWLPPDCCLFQGKGVAVRAHAEERNDLRPVAPHLCREAFAAGDKFFGRELVRCRGAAVDEVGDAVAALEELVLLRWMQLASGKTRQMQR